jgi:hypothetical protein
MPQLAQTVTAAARLHGGLRQRSSNRQDGRKAGHTFSQPDLIIAATAQQTKTPEFAGGCCRRAAGSRPWRRRRARTAPHCFSRFCCARRVLPVARDIKGAMFLTTDNAQAQATLLLGPEKILRLEPTGAAAAIELDDWVSAVAQLVPLAKTDFESNRAQIASFFREKVAPRHRFYTEPITTYGATFQ